MEETEVNNEVDSTEITTIDSQENVANRTDHEGHTENNVDASTVNNHNEVIRTASIEEHTNNSNHANQAYSKDSDSKHKIISRSLISNVLWFVTMALVVAVMLVPIVLYYTKPPTIEPDLPMSRVVDIETCSVSYVTVNVFIYVSTCH